MFFESVIDKNDCIYKRPSIFYVSDKVSTINQIS